MRQQRLFKECSQCKEVKPLSAYSSPDASRCAGCVSALLSLGVHVAMRRCSRCKEVKPKTDFYKSKSKKDGYCRACYCEYAKEYQKKRQEDSARYKLYLEKVRETQRRWRERNSEKVKECNKKYRERNIEKILKWQKIYDREIKLIKRPALSIFQSRVVAYFNDQCAYCETPLSTINESIFVDDLPLCEFCRDGVLELESHEFLIRQFGGSKTRQIEKRVKIFTDWSIRYKNKGKS